MLFIARGVDDALQRLTGSVPCIVTTVGDMFKEVWQHAKTSDVVVNYEAVNPDKLSPDQAVMLLGEDVDFPPEFIARLRTRLASVSNAEGSDDSSSEPEVVTDPLLQQEESEPATEDVEGAIDTLA